MAPSIASEARMGPNIFWKWNEDLHPSIRKVVVELCKPIPLDDCQCEHLFTSCPTTRNSLGHVVFKQPCQWREAFSPDVVDFFCGNARGRLWWSDSSKRDAIDTMLEKMGELTLPTPVFSDGATDTLPIFDPHTLHQIKKAVLEDVEHHESFPKQGTT